MHCRTWMSISLILVVAGCVVKSAGPERAQPDQLSRRASFDLSCPEDAVTVFPIDDNTSGVEGCGQRATYISVCSRDQGCVWTLDSRGSIAPAPAPAP